ncbi:terminase small subunit [Methylomonas montana]|uniref:terminase small subunit n=1 Tax=Methylomonas montana TaxID=3058963 RepID=UPI00265A025D|nr:terminase small subunit [Methylomonas montana]WKJ88770.1 terminase small subunit [Methylomonas montana]
MTERDPGLTDKEWLFCNEYLIDLNGTQAAKRAGYSEKSARQQATKLLSKASIQVSISRLRSDREERTQVTADRVLREVGRIALVDPRKAFDKNNALLPVQDWPDEIAAAISSIKILEVKDSEGNIIGETKEIKFWDKAAALTLAARHLGMLNDKVTLDVTDNLADRLARARLRVGG